MLLESYLLNWIIEKFIRDIYFFNLICKIYNNKWTNIIIQSWNNQSQELTKSNNKLLPKIHTEIWYFIETSFSITQDNNQRNIKSYLIIIQCKRNIAWKISIIRFDLFLIYIKHQISIILNEWYKLKIHFEWILIMRYIDSFNTKYIINSLSY